MNYRCGLLRGICLLSLIGVFGGCARHVGQVELFAINENGKLKAANEVEFNSTRSAIKPDFGDPIRFNSDVLFIYANDAYLQYTPTTLVGSHDVVVFAEVWENALDEQTTQPLVSVVYTNRDVRIPGRLNFEGKTIYGPTNFKGHPVLIRFTIMVLTKDATDQSKQVVSLAESLANTAAPQASPITSAVAGILRDILAAQPDVDMFDFETVLHSDQPQALEDVLEQKLGAVDAATQTTAAPSNQHPLMANMAPTPQKLTSNQRADLAQIIRKSKSNGLSDQRLDATLTRLETTNEGLTTDDRAAIAENKSMMKRAAGQLAAADYTQTTAQKYRNQQIWLGYGDYALIETRPMTDDEDAAKDYRLFQSENGYCKIHRDRGMLWNGKSPLQLNYVTFTIDPTAQKEQDSDLIAAAQKSATFLTSLQSAPVDLDATLSDITTQATSMSTAVIKSKMEAIAQQASSAADYSTFESNFNALYAKSKIADNPAPNVNYTQLENDVLTEWQSRYDQLTQQTTQPAP